MWPGPPTGRVEPSGKVYGTWGRGLGLKKGERLGKLDIWIRMPVHPESAMRGEVGVEMETEDKTLKGRGQVRGKFKASRG